MIRKDKYMWKIEDLISKIKILLGVVMALVHIYFLGFNPIDPWVFLHIHLAFGTILGLLHYPVSSNFLGGKTTAFDLVTAILPAIAAIYFITQAETLPYRVIVAPNLYDTIFSAIIVIYVLEVARRCLGCILPIISLIFLAYSYFGRLIPGILGHRGYNLIINLSQSTSTSGIFGVSLTASAYYVFLLVLFSSFLMIGGAESFLIDISCSIAGKQRGGPAKIAVIASALFGTISGNSVANVVATGSITIPMMKKIGYERNFAGAVEAVASTGGQIMPPIMGAAAFIMVEITGYSYLKIMSAALIPAILYFLSVYLMIDLQAAKFGIPCLSEEDITPFAKVMKDKGFFIIPLLVLILSIVVLRTSVVRASLLAIASVLIVTTFKRDTRMGYTKIINALYGGAKTSVVIISACACAGIVVGVIMLTGLGFKATELILFIAGGKLYPSLILAAVAALILGMGIPTTASYLICAAVVSPALIKLGISTLAAHLFVFYFACLSAITPPVALAAFAGAGIAEGSPMKVGFVAMKLGFAAYLAPFIFAAGGKELLLEGNFLAIIVSIITSIIGIMSLSMAFQGWIWIKEKKIGTTPRLLLFIASLCTITPGLKSDIIGLACIATAFFADYIFDILHKNTNKGNET